MVLAPEHPLVEAMTTPERRDEVRGYVEAARRQTEIERVGRGEGEDGGLSRRQRRQPTERPGGAHLHSPTTP